MARNRLIRHMHLGIIPGSGYALDTGKINGIADVEHNKSGQSGPSPMDRTAKSIFSILSEHPVFDIIIAIIHLRCGHISPMDDGTGNTVIDESIHYTSLQEPLTCRNLY